MNKFKMRSPKFILVIVAFGLTPAASIASLNIDCRDGSKTVNLSLPEPSEGGRDAQAQGTLNYFEGVDQVLSFAEAVRTYVDDEAKYSATDKQGLRHSLSVPQSSLDYSSQDLKNFTGIFDDVKLNCGEQIQ